MLKAKIYESTGLNRIVANKSHSVIVAKHVICEINDEFIIDEWAWFTAQTLLPYHAEMGLSITTFSSSHIF